MKLKSLMKCIVITAIAGSQLAGCGGGSGNGTTIGTNNNKVSISKAVLSAGQSATLTADTGMLNASPTKMQWTAINMTGDAHVPIVINNADCASASFSAATTTATIGTGHCLATLTIPSSLADGTWKITNTASSASGSVSDSVDISVSTLTPSGFRVIESSIPISANMGILTRLTTQFAMNTGYTASNVKYSWTADATNATPITIVGSRNASPSVTPEAAGLYKLNVVINADINGTTETATGSVYLSVAAQNTIDIVHAGAPQIVTSGDVVHLVGEVNAAEGTQYAYTWSQITSAGAPAVVSIMNTNAPTASFVAPAIAGTYGFQLTVTKTLPNGTQSITSAQTSVIVNAKPLLAFNLFAGDSQIANAGTVVYLKGLASSEGSSTDVTYSYAWTQVGATPAVVAISNSNSLTGTFIPTVAGNYTFALSVTATSHDGTATANTTTQVNVVSSNASAANVALSADAGLAQSVAANTVVALTGLQTTQGNAPGAIYAYEWTQTGSTPTPVTLSTPSNRTASFTPTVNGTYSFNLVVTMTLVDGSTRIATSDTQVVVGGISNGFSVSAGEAAVQAVNISAAMHGIVTTQGVATNAIYAYEWTQVGATPALAAISNVNSLTASFIPTVTGTYTFNFSVTATDNGVTTTRSAQTQVLVTP